MPEPFKSILDAALALIDAADHIPILPARKRAEDEREARDCLARLGNEIDRFLALKLPKLRIREPYFRPGGCDGPEGGRSGNTTSARP
jgi:hypothetical protein